jgi:hypothetical protein
VGDYVFGSLFESPYIFEQFIGKLRLLGSLIDNLKITFKTLPTLYPLKPRMMKQRVEKYSRIAYYRVVTLSGPNRWSFLDGVLIAASIGLVYNTATKLLHLAFTEKQNQLFAQYCDKTAAFSIHRESKPTFCTILRQNCCI